MKDVRTETRKKHTKTTKIDEIKFRFGVVLPLLLADNRNSTDIYDLFAFNKNEEKTVRINKTTRYVQELKKEKTISLYFKHLLPRVRGPWAISPEAIARGWKNGMVALLIKERFKDTDLNKVRMEIVKPVIADLKKEINAIKPIIRDHSKIIFRLSYLNFYPRFDYENEKILNVELARYINSRILIFLIMCLKTLYYELNCEEEYIHETIRRLQGFHGVLSSSSYLYRQAVSPNEEDSAYLKELGKTKLRKISKKLLAYLYFIDSKILEGINVRVGSENISDNTVNITYNWIDSLMKDVEDTKKYFFIPHLSQREYLLLFRSRITSKFLEDE